MEDPEESVFTSYRDIYLQKGKTATEIYNFIHGIESTPKAKLIEVDTIDDDFETYFENKLQEMGVISENGMVFEDSIISSIPFSSSAERVDYVTKECDMVFFDNKFAYIIKHDYDEEYMVQKTKKENLKELF